MKLADLQLKNSLNFIAPESSLPCSPQHTHQWSPSSARQTLSTSLHPTSLWFILIIPSLQSTDLPSESFLQVFPWKSGRQFSSLPFVLHAPSMSSSKIWSSLLGMISSTNIEAQQAIFTNLLVSSSLSGLNSLSPAPCSWIFPTNINIKITITTILYVLLYRYEHFYIILKQKQRLKFPHSRVLKRNVWSGKLTAGWRKLHNVTIKHITLNDILLALSYQGTWWKQGM